MSRLDPTKCDDMESLAYTILFLVKGTLPWMNKGYADSSVKSEAVPEELFAGSPPIFAKFLRYCRELEPSTEPDYDYYMTEFAKASLVRNAGDLEV